MLHVCKCRLKGGTLHLNSALNIWKLHADEMGLVCTYIEDLWRYGSTVR